jgi:antitoxin (DNA-binding transcriptional repressor) of toxin-antitoxin stability system
MQFNVHAAKTNLSKLIDAALAGETVVIARDSVPLVELVPVRPKKRFVFGILQGQLGTGPDFFEPMDETDLALWEGRGDDHGLA